MYTTLTHNWHIKATLGDDDATHDSQAITARQPRDTRVVTLEVTRVERTTYKRMVR